MADIITSGCEMSTLELWGGVQKASITAGEVWALVASQVTVLTLAA